MKSKYFKIVLGIGVAEVLLAIGCQSNDKGDKTEPKQLSVAPAKGGAELWADNCSRCHNSRPPESYNDAQWAAVVHHMRLRADLTGEEARQITAFLQASH